MQRQREIRRSLGALSKGLSVIDLEQVADTRSEPSSRWSLVSLLTAVLSGCVAGCRSLKETELLTVQLSGTVAKALGLLRRVPDTTMRDALMGLQLEEARGLLHRQTRNAHRRKQLQPQGLPCGVLAIDGKYSRTMKPKPGAPGKGYAQQQKDGSWLVRRMSCALISARVPLCVDMIPLPREVNEMSILPQVLAELDRHYGSLDLFEVLTADAGLTSEENARAIDALDLGYVLGLKDNQPTLLDEAHRLLGRLPAKDAEAFTEDRIDNRTTVIRRVWRTTEIAKYHGWEHLRTVVRVQSEKRRGCEVVEKHDRFFISNLPHKRFTAAQWLQVIRGHWRVENECHGVWDRFFREDDHPWLKVAHGQLIIDVLRRVAFNILDIYRRISRRPRPKREEHGMRWCELFSWMRLALTAATHADASGLRWAWASRDGPPIGRLVR